jgi:hypothetical protein
VLARETLEDDGSLVREGEAATVFDELAELTRDQDLVNGRHCDHVAFTQRDPLHVVEENHGLSP